MAGLLSPMVSNKNHFQRPYFIHFLNKWALSKAPLFPFFIPLLSLFTPPPPYFWKTFESLLDSSACIPMINLFFSFFPPHPFSLRGVEQTIFFYSYDYHSVKRGLDVGVKWRERLRGKSSTPPYPGAARSALIRRAVLIDDRLWNKCSARIWNWMGLITHKGMGGGGGIKWREKQCDGDIYKDIFRGWGILIICILFFHFVSLDIDVGGWDY